MATTTKISKKELQHDEFVEKVFDLGEWLETNWKTAAAAAGGVVAVVLIAIGFMSWRASTAREANLLLSRGLDAFQPERKADGTTPSPRYDEALKSFEQAADKGGSRPIGDVARFYRARTLIALGRTSDALPILEGLRGAVPSVAGQAKLSLAQAQIAGGQLDKAAALLQELSASPDAAVPQDVVLSQLAALHVKAGKPDEAKKVYQDLIARFPEGSSAAEARRRLADLGVTGAPAGAPGVHQ